MYDRSAAVCVCVFLRVSRVSLRNTRSYRGPRSAVHVAVAETARAGNPPYPTLSLPSYSCPSPPARSLMLCDCPGLVFPRLDVSLYMQVSAVHTPVSNTRGHMSRYADVEHVVMQGTT